MQNVAKKNAAVRFIGINVLDAARARVKFLYENFPNVVISVSGGKDSLICLLLALEYCEERGRRVKAVFRDEEFIPKSVLDAVEVIRQMPNVDLDYLAIKSLSSINNGIEVSDYYQNDESRQRLRPLPPHARIVEGVFSQDRFDTNIYLEEHPGEPFCLVMGVRASESLQRRAAIINARSFVSPIKNVNNFFIAKPIYDWNTNDVFKYIYEKNAPLCDLYTDLARNGEKMRIATVLHAQAGKSIASLRARDVETYERILEIFPDAEFASLFHSQRNGDKEFAKYSRDLKGCLEYCKDKHKGEVYKAHAWAVIRAFQQRDRGHYNLYPILHIFQCIQQGSGKLWYIPVCSAPTKQMIEYERQAI